MAKTVTVTLDADGGMSIKIEPGFPPPMLFTVAKMLERTANAMLDANDMQQAMAANQIASLGDLRNVRKPQL
jgi:hypothetical protein